MELFLFYFFSLFLVISSFSVIFTENSVKSVFFLILAFCNSCGLLFLVDAEFLALLFLVVYIGAIAVLFLFVVIILKLKNDFSLTLSKIQFSFYIPASLFFCFFSIYELSFFIGFDLTLFNYNFFFKEPRFFEWVFVFDFCDNLHFFGQTLFNFYFCFLLVVGFILLVSMLSAVCLTNQKQHLFTNSKKQRTFEQLARNFISAIFKVKLENL